MKLSTATSLVLKSRDELSKFLMGTNGDLEEECRSAMLHDYMDLSRLMVHVRIAARRQVFVMLDA